MNRISYLVRNFFSPTDDNKTIAACFLILIAVFLVLVSSETYANFRNLKKIVPPVSDMATSPIAADLINKKLSEKAVSLENKSENTPNQIPNRPQKIVVINAKDLIVIPKIGAEVPIVTAQTLDNNKLHSLLDEGVVLYPGSAGFGNIGQTVLMGHSAPANWPKIKHDTVFSRINELVPGDRINIVYAGRTYVYLVTRSQVIPKGGDFSGGPSAASTLTLVSCWPPGQNQKRMAVEAVNTGN